MKPRVYDDLTHIEHPPVGEDGLIAGKYIPCKCCGSVLVTGSDGRWTCGNSKCELRKEIESKKEKAMDSIDVSKIDPAELLAALYNHSRPMGMGVLQAKEGDMTKEAAQKLLSGQDMEGDYDGLNANPNDRNRNGISYFDYLHGRPLKIEINGKVLRTALYDRDNGQGAAQEIIEALQCSPAESVG